MIQITKPKNLDGQKIINFLAEENINVIGYPFLDGNEMLFIEVLKEDENKALSLMDNF